MFVKDGTAYVGEPVPEMRIESARVTGELTMLVTFATGETPRVRCVVLAHAAGF